MIVEKQSSKFNIMSSLSYKLAVFYLILSFLLLILSLICDVKLVNCSRSKLYYKEEPTELDVYKDYRAVNIDRSYYYLKTANLLKNSDIQPYESIAFEGSTDNLNFNSDEFVQRVSRIAWFLAGTERISLHIYDDPREMELASGPQVNQQLCGLLLDYMIYMTEKHHKHFTNSTEMSIFYILNTFGSPTVGLNVGNTIFPGDYQSCIKTKLNVIKEELNKVNKRESEFSFHKLNKQKLNSQNKKKNSKLRNVFKTIKDYIFHFLDLYEGYDGDYLLIKKYQNKIKAVPTRYCMAGLRWPNWPNSTFHKRTLAIRVGVCLPDVCDSNSIKFYHDKIKRLTEIQIPEYYKGYYINNLYCLPDKNSPLRNMFNYQSAKLWIAFTTIWVSLLVVSTLMRPYKEKNLLIANTNANDLRNSSQQLHETTDNLWYFLSCWCLTKNLSDFLGLNRNSNQNQVINNEKKEEEKEDKGENSQVIINNSIDLTPLEGFKVFASFAVVISHILILAFGVSWNALVGHRLMSKSILASVSSIGPTSVDCFFVVTGLISAYYLLQQPKSLLMKPIFWVQFLAYRYIRVIPIYLLIHWSIQSSGRFIGSGPFWDYATSYTAWGKRCQNDSLWGVIFPSANFKSPTAQCNPVGWYLANDIQFALVTPFIIVLYLKNAFIANLTVLTTCIVVMLNHIRYYYYYDLPESNSGLEFSIFTVANIVAHGSQSYTNPQYRCLSYFIGLATGHLLNEYKKGDINKWSTLFINSCKILVWFTAAILTSIPYLAHLLPIQNIKLMHLLGSIFGGTIHGLASFGAAAFLILICTGHFEALRKLLGREIFKTMAKASLCTCLIHSPIIFYHIHSIHSLPEISVYYMISMSLIWLIESLIASAALHVLVEVPMRKFLLKSLIKLFAGRRSKSKEHSNDYKQQSDISSKEKVN